MQGTTRGTEQAPKSSSPPVQSLADVRRRLRTGAVVQYDELDNRGRTTASFPGTVVERDAVETHPAFKLVADDGRERTEYLPERARDCEFWGASVSWPGGRIWFIDEANVVPPAEPKPKKSKPPPLPDGWQDDITSYLAGELGCRSWETRWRYWYSPVPRGPFFGWTTVTDENGEWLSWVAVPTGPGARSGRAVRFVVDPESVRRHGKRKDARARAERVLEEWKANGGKPWR